MRMDIDKSRCHVAATGVVHCLRVTKIRAYCDNGFTRDCHIRCVGLAAGAIDDGAAANNQIVSHGFVLIFGIPAFRRMLKSLSTVAQVASFNFRFYIK